MEDWTGSLSLLVCGISVRLDSRDLQIRSILRQNFGRFRVTPRPAKLTYHIRKVNSNPAFVITRSGEELILAVDSSEFIYLLEKDLTIELQKIRSDLYFLHAAALEFRGSAVLLIAPSGGGKSTTTWSLLHHGFGYLSDELSPVDLESLRVHPYPHALCLKDDPPIPYPLPVRILRTSRTLHVPVTALPCQAANPRCLFPLKAVVFLVRKPENGSPGIREVGKAEAGTRLFVNALNPLAHPGDGLDGALALVDNVSCFELVVTDLRVSCKLLRSTLERKRA